MKFLNTIHERKSAVKTAIVMALLILSFFIVGMTYLDPPDEMGIEVNFGTSDLGSGDIQPKQEVQTMPQQAQSQAEETPQEETSVDETEEVVTQDTEEEAPVIKPKPVEKPKPKPEPKPNTSEADNALNSILNSNNAENGNTNQGEGPDNTAGDKGQIDGNPYANAYYGGGSGSGSGYGLNGRSKVSFKKEKPTCNEEGRVVVQIEVDRNGNVIKAIPGVKGTTNSANCLLEPAKRTALSYRFNSDSKAPKKQIGFVVINFSLN